MKKIFFIVAMVSAIIAKGQKQFVVDPNAEMRTLSGSFNAIKVSGGIDLYLTQSNEEAIAVSAAEDKFKQGIRTVVENNVLKIYYDGNRNWSLKKQMKAYVS